MGFDQAQDIPLDIHQRYNSLFFGERRFRGGSRSLRSRTLGQIEQFVTARGTCSSDLELDRNSFLRMFMISLIESGLKGHLKSEAEKISLFLYCTYV